MLKKIIIVVFGVVMVLPFVLYLYITNAYILNISVNQTTLSQGENIELTMVFENNSGLELQISYGGFVANYYVVGHDYYSLDRYNLPQVVSTIPKGKSEITVTMGNMLEKGTHELVAVTKLGFKNVRSNTILLTVI